MSACSFAEEVNTTKYLYRELFDYLIKKHNIHEEEGLKVLEQIGFTNMAYFDIGEESEET